jgi:hypothetical protein
MKVSEILDLLPDEKLQQIGEKLQVDKKNTKITGSFIVKTFVRSSLLKRPISLRTIEFMSNNTSSLNRLLKTKSSSKAKIDHSSLGKRLNNISTNYFEEVYKDIVVKAEKILPKNDKSRLHKFDSTITSLAGRVVKDGINVGGNNKENQIKLTVGLKNSLPSSVRFCKEQSESSEDIALVRAINESKLDTEDILLFDRGISKGTTYQDFSNRGIKFVTRVKQNRKHKVIEKRAVKDVGNLKIISDEIINFYDKHKKVIEHDVRLIKAINTNNTEIWFLSNLFDFSVLDITGLYARRWDIEVFFKFIKQHLQFKHFINHSLNGMKVYMYCLLIAAILFLLFKYTNKKIGFKIPLLEFTMLLEKEILKDLIILSGGNLQSVRHLL